MSDSKQLIDEPDRGPVKEVLAAALGQLHMFLVGTVCVYLFWYAYTHPKLGMSARTVEVFLGVVAVVLIGWGLKLTGEKAENVEAV